MDEWLSLIAGNGSIIDRGRRRSSPDCYLASPPLEAMIHRQSAALCVGFATVRALTVTH
jgi:hypothetical protein